MRLKIFGTFAFALLMLSFCQPILAKPNWTELDYDSDGIVDCKYQVIERQTEGTLGDFIRVVYRDLDCTYLGEELFSYGLGVIKDTFEPWTYPFPS